MQKIYIETSVVSYLTARVSKNIIIAGHQIITKDFWEQLDIKNAFISELVLQEASQGDELAAQLRVDAIKNLKELEIDKACKMLAQILLDENVIPKEFPEDALHIAVAAVHNMDVIVTWNFKHINNPVMRCKIKVAVEKAGYKSPELCSPEEFVGENYE